MDYRPKDRAMWDAWFIEHEGVAHAFHLQKPLPGDDQTNPDFCEIGHATSTDFLKWTEHPPALRPNLRGTPMDDMQPWTGCVIPHRNQFLLYYTMRDSANRGRIQRIGLASSADLYTWDRCSGNPVIEPGDGYCNIKQPYMSGANPVVDCRDLVVVPHPAGGWLGYYAARKHTRHGVDGSVIACVRSDDLYHWQHLQPALELNRYAVLEVPEVFEIQGIWYMTCLTGNGYGMRCPYANDVTEGTIWAWAERPEGPFRLVEGSHELISGNEYCGYSCRSFVYQGERVMCYIQRVPYGIDTLSPPMQVAVKDQRLCLMRSRFSRERHWSTRLGNALLPSITSHVPTHGNWMFTPGHWVRESGGYVGVCERGHQVAMTDLLASEFECQAVVDCDAEHTGFVLREPCVEPHDPRAIVIGIDPSGYAFVASLPQFAVSLRRRITTIRNKPVQLCLSVRDARFELYADDELVLQSALPAGGLWNLGLFVENGQVRYSEPEIVANETTSTCR